MTSRSMSVSRCMPVERYAFSRGGRCTRNTIWFASTLRVLLNADLVQATDMVMQKCLDERAAYVLAPCCVGKIKLSALEYPRSKALRQELTRTEYQVLAKAADFGHMNAAMSHSEINMRRRRCKSILESDRHMRAQEDQYQTFMFVMHPHDVTPKNDVLVGIPAGDVHEKRRFAISCDQPLSETDTTRVIFGL